MKSFKAYRIISIIAYSFIVLKGEMIGLPFLLWLAFAVFDFGNIDQLFALLAVLGLIHIFQSWNKTKTQKIVLTEFVCFFLLATPLVNRLTSVPLNKFNYSAFIVPTGAFVCCYLISLVYTCKQYLALQKASLQKT